MKLKYYLRGLGIGILVTAIIFMIGIHVNREELFSDEEVIARAKSLGMVMGETQTKTLDELEEEQKKNQEKQKEEEEKKEEQKKDGNNEEKKTDTTENQKTEKTDADAAPQTQTVKQVEVNILPGEYSDTISQKLFDAGLIADITEFNRFITDSDYDNFIQPGTFTIPEGSSYEDIAQILMTKQENR